MVRDNNRMVKDAMDMLDGYISQIAGPLEQARVVAFQAHNLLNLSACTERQLLRIIKEIDRIVGSGSSESGGTLNLRLRSIHETII